MSGNSRGNQNNFDDYTSFDPNGSNGPPPLRQPNLSSAQLSAAAKMGFSDKYLPSGVGNNASSNGRGHSNSYSAGDSLGRFPEIGQFSADDYVDGHQGINSQHQQVAEQEGLLPPLRRPHNHEMPPEVLGVLLKENRFEGLLAQNQQVPKNSTERCQSSSASTTSQSPHSQTTRPRNNNVYYQSQGSTPDRSAHQQSPRPRMPQHHNHGSSQSSHQNFKMLQNPTGINKNSPASASQSAGRQIKVQLSADAKEFIPSTNTSESNNALMTHQEESELAQAVAQFQLQNQPDLIHFDQGAYPTEKSSCVEDSSDYILSTTTDSIMDLTSHPANFARCAKAVTEVLKNFGVDLDTLNVVVTLLVEQSISIPNFCYSGARLAEVLVKNGIAVNNTTFKVLLLTRCQEEFKACIENMQNDPQVMARCRGLLMYFGELFMNIRTATGTPIIVLGLGILEMMQKLVKDPSYENIKCIFQALKLVGWDLENSNDAKMKDNFEQLMKDLCYLSMASSNVKPQTKLLLDMLIELKNKRWNREEISQENSQCPTSSSVSSTSTPPSSIPSNNIYELPLSDDDYEDNDCILIDDEPDEVQRAYEEFLKSTQ